MAYPIIQDTPREHGSVSLSRFHHASVHHVTGGGFAEVTFCLDLERVLAKALQLAGINPCVEYCVADFGRAVETLAIFNGGSKVRR